MYLDHGHIISIAIVVILVPIPADIHQHHQYRRLGNVRQQQQHSLLTYSLRSAQL